MNRGRPLRPGVSCSTGSAPVLGLLRRYASGPQEPLPGLSTKPWIEGRALGQASSGADACQSTGLPGAIGHGAPATISLQRPCNNACFNHLQQRLLQLVIDLLQSVFRVGRVEGGHDFADLARRVLLALPARPARASASRRAARRGAAAAEARISIMVSQHPGAHIQYAPVPHVDCEQQSPHAEARGALPPGHKGCQLANGHPSHPPARSMGSQHTSGHKDFATFSAVPAQGGADAAGRADPSFLHYVALAMSLTASSAAAFGVPKVMAFSIPGWLTSLNMSRTTLSALISAGNLAGALAQPYIGRCVDRFGPRFALAGMLALTSVAFTAPSFALGMDSAILRAAVMASAIFGIRSLQAGIDTAGNVLVNHWFLKLRGRVSSTRQVLFLSVQDLVLVQIVQGMDDWQATCWLSAAVAACAVCVVLLGSLLKPRVRLCLCAV